MTRAASLANLASPEVLSVDSSNNIGINSTTPDAKLDVVGIVSATSFYGDGANLTNVPAGGLTGTPDITVNNVVGAAATFTGVLTYEDVANVDSLGIITARSGLEVTGGNIRVSAAGSVIIGDGTNWGYYVSDANLQISDDTNAKLVLNNPGNASYSFAVGTDNDLIIRDESQTKDRMVIDFTNGNIGIGTIGPEDLLHLYSGNSGASAISQAQLVLESSGSNNWIHFKNKNNQNAGLAWSDPDNTEISAVMYNHNTDDLEIKADDDIKFITNSSERLRIGSDGLLDVSGGIQVSENITPTAGSGVEIFKPDASTGQISAFNRTGGAWMDLKIKADNINFFSQGTESLGIGASVVHFKNTGLVEQETKDFLDTKLGTNGRVSLKNGNVARFTGNETGSTSVNFIDVHSELSVGDTVSFTVIIRPNGAGYINAVYIDSVSIPASDTQLNWQGGSAPSSGSSDGYDVYTFQVIKTGSGTSDYLVLASTPVNYT